MARPVLRAAPTAHATDGVTSGSTPSGTLSGDTVIAVQEVDFRSTADFVAPGGDITDWQPLTAALSYGNVILRAWIGHAPSDGAKTVSVSQGGGNSGNHLILRTYQGAVEVDAGPTSAGGTNATSLSVPQVDPTVSDAVLVGYWAGGGFSPTPTPADPVTITPPASMPDSRATARLNEFFGLFTGAQDLTSDAATGARAASTSTTTDAGWVGILFALRGPSVAPTQPSLVQTYPETATTSPATLQTASFTPNAGEVLVVKVVAGDETTVLGAPSGGGLTWTERAASAATNFTPERLFTAVVGGSPSAMTVSVSTTGSQTSYPTLIVERWASAALAATPATNATKTGSTATAMSATVTTTGTNSVVTWVGGDWTPVTSGTVTYRPGATENYQRRTSGINVWSAWQPAPTAGAQTIGTSAPTGQKWTMLGVELLGVAGGGPVTQQGAAALTAADALTVAAVQAHQVAQPLSAFDTLTVAAVRHAQVAAPLAATSTLTAGAARSAVVAAPLTGTDTLTAAADRDARVTAPLTGTDTLTVGATQQHLDVAAPLAAADTLTPDAGRSAQVTAGLAAHDTLAVPAWQTHKAAAPLTGTDTLAATPGQAFTTALAATDTLTVGDDISHGHAAAADLAAADTLTAGATQTHQAGAALTAADTVDVAGARVHPAAVALAGADALEVAGTRVKIGAAELAAQDTLAVADVLRSAVVAAALSADDALNATAASSSGGALNISVWAVDRQQGDRLVPLPGVVSGTVSDVANEPGAVTIAHRADGSPADQLLRRDVADDSDLEVEIWLGGRRSTALRGYLDSVEGDDVAENGVRSYTGSLMLVRLDQAWIAPQPADEKLEYRVAAATPGAMGLQLLAQCQARGVLTDITADFTATHDSEGAEWPELFTGKWSPGTTLLAWVQSLVDLALCETELTAQKEWRLYVFGGRGVARTAGLTPVTLRRGRNLGEAGRRSTVRGAGTDFLVAAGEGNYRTETVPNARARRGRAVEVSSSVGQIDELGALMAASQRVAASGTSGADERTFALALTSGQPRPVQSFDVGDVLRVDTDGSLTAERVAQWELSWDASTISGLATTGDLIRSRMAGLLRRLNAVGSGTAIIGTSEPTEDTGIPLAPTGLVVGSGAFLEGQDVYASVTAGWLAVQSNVDGTAATDLEGYRVEWALESRPDVWNLGADVQAGDTDASWSTAPGTPIRVRVQAYDRSGNRSAWSNVVQHLTDDDATPPPVASQPLVADYLGTVRVTWDGLSAAGLDMYAAAADFSHVELHLSTASNFAPDTAAWPVGTLVTNLYGRGTWTIADLPYGVTQYARLVPVDTRGNRQPTASVQGSATPGKLVSIDFGPESVDRAAIKKLAVGTGEIDNLAVNNAKISDLSVGKLTAGTLTADVTLSSIIRTALTGGRSEMDNAGFRLYDPAEQLRVQFKTSDGSALVTGEYRSALSGRRFIINPGGSIPDEIRFYRSGGLTNYGRIRAIDTGQGTGLNIRSGQVSGSLSAETLVTVDSAAMLYGDIEQGWHRSRVVVDNDHSYVSSPVVDISADTRYPTGDAGAQRISFFRVGGNGLLIPQSLLELRSKVDWEPWFHAPNKDSGVVFGDRQVHIANNLGGWQGITANGFNLPSSQDLKDDIRDARAVLNPLQAIRGARARAFVYEQDRWVQPPVGDPKVDEPPDPVAVEPPTRVGVLAEDLPEALQVTLPDGTPAVDLAAQVGTLWGAVGQILDQQIRTVVGRVTLTSGGPFLAGATRDLEVAWDEAPLEVPTGGVVTVHAGVAWLGKATAVIVPGSLTAQGCTVRARFLAAVVPTAGQPITFEPQGLYLWTPPYEGAT